MIALARSGGTPKASKRRKDKAPSLHTFVAAASSLLPFGRAVGSYS